MPGTSSGRGSILRSIAAGMSLLASLVTLPAGFVMMVRALEATGYGSPAVTRALLVLATGGGLLGFGIALLIWELSVRYNVRH